MLYWRSLRSLESPKLRHLRSCLRRMKSSASDSKLLWMVVLTLSCMANMPLAADDEILLAFKNGVTDEAGVLSNWNSSSPVCTWYGVSCDNNRRVSALKLNSAQLSGSISSALGGLSNLENLTLSNNKFSGFIPVELGNCSNLQNMLLGSNSLGGAVPPSFGNLIFLKVLNLSSNSLNGSIPAELGKCVRLNRIFLNNNSLSSTIPSELGNCSLLQELDISDNFLSGKIPDSLESCATLETLNLTLNMISGLIPPSIGNFSSSVGSMLRLYLGHNSFSGPFPEELFKLECLGELDLVGNMLTGSLPDKFDQFQRLTKLDLSFNMFKGPIPSSIGLGNALLELRLSNNQFEGLIPASFTDLNSPQLLVLDLSNNFLSDVIPSSFSFRMIQTINLAENNLTGSIPASLGNCLNLSSLDLSNNFFSGNIPDFLGSLKDLNVLQLAKNKLTGRVPSSVGNLTSLEILDLSSNFLYGSIPPELGKCVQLDRLFLNNNFRLNGSVPSALGNLISLQYLRLSSNDFSFGIPLELGNCSLLQELDMSSNSLIGQIPDSLESCPLLGTLNLTGNFLSGTIPPSIGNFSSKLLSGLRLYFGYNLLSGTFPEELFKLKSLGELVLTRNKLNASLPDKFDQFESDQSHVGLSKLDLSFNMFTGDIPSSIGQIRHALLHLILSNNRFEGPIPPSLGGLTSLLSLDLSSNFLSGTLPIWSFTFIQKINLTGNNLTGSIPESLCTKGSCPSLTCLAISHNSLTDGIPQSLEFLLVGDGLRLANNNLSGSVDNFSNSTFTAASFLPGNPGLCGALLNRTCPPPARHTGRAFFEKWWKEVVIASVVAGFCLFVVLASWVDIVLARSRHRRKSVAYYYVGGLKVVRLSVDDLVKATGRFSPSNVVGSGGTSTVYRGLLQFYPFIIAVKKFDDTKDGRRRLLKEAGMMKSIRHRHLVGTLGISSIPKSINVLVLEYMVNGTLNQHLHESEVCELSWDVRLSILKDVATAICYLHKHAGAGYKFIHGDLKPANIFLDSDFLAKIGDFGLMRIVVDGSQHLARTERVWEGTFGYAPPEHGEGLFLTAGDVYSFGVVVLEVVTRRRPTDALFTEPGVSLVSWVRDYFPEKMSEIVDPSLAQELSSNADAVELLLKIGLLCTRDNPRERPEINEAMEMINTIAKADADSSSALPDPIPTVEELAAEPSSTSFQHQKNWGCMNDDFLFDIRDSYDESWFSLFKIDLRDSRVLNAMGFGSPAFGTSTTCTKEQKKSTRQGSGHAWGCFLAKPGDGIPE